MFFASVLLLPQFPSNHHESVLLHLFTSEGTARIASVYFDNANSLLNCIEVIKHSTSIYSSVVILLNLAFCPLCRVIHIDSKCVSSDRKC
jgi:hypothetical protein